MRAIASKWMKAKSLWMSMVGVMIGYQRTVIGKMIENLGVKWLSCTFSYKFISTACTHAFPNFYFSSSGNFLRGEEGEKLGEVCILDNCQHDSRSTK